MSDIALPDDQVARLEVRAAEATARLGRDDRDVVAEDEIHHPVEQHAQIALKARQGDQADETCADPGQPARPGEAENIGD